MSNTKPSPRKTYRVRQDDTTYFYAVFSREDDAVEDTLEEFSQGEGDYDTAAIASTLTGWTEFSRGPGRSFGSEPSIRIGRRNVVVRQFVALDV